MKKIYILTTYTGTVLASLIKNISKVPYAHVSIGMDENLEEVYSFGRKHVSNPIFAGFVREYIDRGLYKRQKNTMCRVYSIDVEDSQYEKIKEELNKFILNKDKYKYDAIALFRLLNNNPRENEYKYVCSQFVAHILNKGDIHLFDKESCLVTPMDFYKSDRLYIKYEGLLSEYRKNISLKSYSEYCVV